MHKRLISKVKIIEIPLQISSRDFLTMERQIDRATSTAYSFHFVDLLKVQFAWPSRSAAQEAR